MDSSSANVLAGILAGFGVFLLILLAWGIVFIVALWKVYKKMGRPGWAIFVPFYGSYVGAEAASGSKRFAWTMIIVTVIASIASYIATMSVTASIMSVASSTSITSTAAYNSYAGMMPVATILGILSFVVTLLYNLSLANAFGKTAGYAIGLWILPGIFVLMLAFGKAEYVGGKGNVLSNWLDGLGSGSSSATE